MKPTRWQRRWAAVKTAWKRGLAEDALSNKHVAEFLPNGKPVTFTPSVGILVPLETPVMVRELERLRLGSGIQHVFDQPIVVGRAECQIGSKTVFHGDRVEVGARRYRVALLPAKAFVQWFSVWVVAIASAFAQNGTLQPAVPQPQPVFEVNVPEAVQVLYRGRLEIPLTLPGLVQESDWKSWSVWLKASETVASEVRLPIRRVESVRSEYVVVVDPSALCLKWEREETINRHLRQLAAELPRSSVLTVATPAPGGKWNVVVPRTEVGAWTPRDVIQCRPQLDSTNVFEIVGRSKTLFSEGDASRDPVRRVLLVYTPGNARVLASTRDVIEDLDLDVYPVVYAGFQTPTFEAAVQPWFEHRDGRVLWWNDVRQNLVSVLPIAWTASVDFNVPYEIEERPYTVEVRGPNAKWRLDVQYFRDPRAYFLYRAGWILLAVLSVIGGFWGVRTLIRIYQKPICPKTKKLLSHTWKGSLFAAYGRWPILVVMGPWGYEKAVVLDQKRLRIGKRWGVDVKLESQEPEDRTPFVIERVGYESYQLARGKKPYVMSGTRRESPLFLRHGDWISFGPYTLWFLHPKKTDVQAARFA